MQHPDESNEMNDMILPFALPEIDAGNLLDPDHTDRLGKIISRLDNLTSGMHLQLLQTMPVEGAMYEAAVAMMEDEERLIRFLLTHALLSNIQRSKYELRLRNISLRKGDTMRTLENAKELSVPRQTIQTDIVQPAEELPFRPRLFQDDESAA